MQAKSEKKFKEKTNRHLGRTPVQSQRWQIAVLAPVSAEIPDSMRGIVRWSRVRKPWIEWGSASLLGGGVDQIWQRGCAFGQSLRAGRKKPETLVELLWLVRVGWGSSNRWQNRRARWSLAEILASRYTRYLECYPTFLVYTHTEKFLGLPANAGFIPYSGRTRLSWVWL